MSLFFIERCIDPGDVSIVQVATDELSTHGLFDLPQRNLRCTFFQLRRKKDVKARLLDGQVDSLMRASQGSPIELETDGIILVLVIFVELRMKLNQHVSSQCLMNEALVLHSSTAPRVRQNDRISCEDIEVPLEFVLN